RDRAREAAKDARAAGGDARRLREARLRADERLAVRAERRGPQAARRARVCGRSLTRNSLASAANQSFPQGEAAAATSRGAPPRRYDLAPSPGALRGPPSCLRRREHRMHRPPFTSVVAAFAIVAATGRAHAQQPIECVSVDQDGTGNGGADEIVR